MTVITLPYPPSLNRLYRAVKGRSILSEAYRNWRAEAATELMVQRPAAVHGRVSVTVELCPPDKRKRDIDNAGFKAVLDLLTAMRVIDGDHGGVIREITGRWVDSGSPCQVTVRAVA